MDHDLMMSRFAYYEEIEAANSLTNSDWSMSEVADMEAPHPYGGATTITYESHPFWGKPAGTFTVTIGGPRWLDLWIGCDAILGECGDKHHIFIEGFTRSGDTLILHTGS
jgi:hypothetical protein